MALDVRDRRAAGAAGVLPPPLRRPSRRSRRQTRAKQAASGDRPALWEIFSGPILKTTILASLLATGCQGGYYADHLLGAALPDQGAQPVDRRLDRLSLDADHRLFHRLSRRRLARGPHRPAQSVPDLLDRRDGACVLLYTQLPLTQRDPVGARLPAGLLRLGLFLRHRRVPDRALSDAAARLGPGLLLQFRPRHRRAVSVPGRRALGDDDRSPTRSRSSRWRLTCCSSLPPSRCRRRAGACCTRTNPALSPRGGEETYRPT